MMMNRQFFLSSIVALALLVGWSLCAQVPRTNLFNPYDILLAPSFTTPWCWDFFATIEHAFKVRSYQTEEDERGNSNCFRKRADVLQLFEDQQDALAALKGRAPEDYLSQVGQLFNLNDDDGTHGLFIPCGNLKATNVLFSAWWSWSPDWAFSFHLPVTFMKLEDVCWVPGPLSTLSTFESDLGVNVLDAIQKSGTKCLSGWQRAGCGDLLAQLSWEHHFPQARPFLKNVLLYARLGVLFPTGKKQDDYLLLAPAFGNDAGVGLLTALNLDLNLGCHLHMGVDAEITTLFGTRRFCAIKTDMAQTDLLLLSRACVLSDPGFIQHFTLYAGGVDFWRGLSLKLAYQYTKRQEDRLYLGSFHWHPGVVNSAESLQEWTTHDLVGLVSYDFDAASHVQPTLSLLLKYGFNGSRAILFDTASLQFSVAF